MNEKRKTKAAVYIFDKHAFTYQEKYMSVERYAKSLNYFCDTLNSATASILDLACGPGNITAYLLSRKSTLSILGSDLSPKRLDLAKKNTPTARFEIMDFRDLSQFEQKFDGIICSFGLPYISKEDAVQLIHDAAQKLTPDGLLYLSTMEGDYTKSGLVGPSSGGDDRLFMYYHQADYLTEALKTNAFHSIKTERISYKDDNNNVVTDLILIAKK